jgi:hypothetical protein
LPAAVTDHDQDFFDPSVPELANDPKEQWLPADVDEGFGRSWAIETRAPASSND